MRRRFFLLISVVVLVLTMGGCVAPEQKVEPQPAAIPPLRVGVTPDYPPIIFRSGDQLAGLEADFATLLARELNRPLEFVELRWERQIPALLAGETDIVMSGMTVTRAREVRVSFTNPYLNSGLVAMVRRADAQRFRSLQDIADNAEIIGVVAGTTGDAFVQKNFPGRRRFTLTRATDAPFEIKREAFDVFIHDVASVVWLVSENEADLQGLWALLNDEKLAWAVRRDQPEFLKQVNAVLAKWKKDGTANRLLKRWLPYVTLQ